jgi:hypothetical protein
VRFPRLDQYVNDRPYAASSFLSVAIARVFNTALGGRSSTRPDSWRRCCRLRCASRQALVTGWDYPRRLALEAAAAGGK